MDTADRGEFAYPWQRTSVTFDPDINPEGFNEKILLRPEYPVFEELLIVFNSGQYSVKGKIKIKGGDKEAS
jgi:hypothetical protein